MNQIFSKGHFLLPCFLVCFSFISCGESDSNVPEAEEVVLDLVEPVDTVHNTQNSVDYAGTYKGITPCADCEGIEVELTINRDSSYAHSITHLGKGDIAPVKKSGKFVWVNGGTIQLSGVTDGPSKFKVGEGRIWQLDMQGNKVEGELADKYILTKTN